MTPVYVGTDQNISYQGAPRVESPAGGGPFEMQRRQPRAAAPASARASRPRPRRRTSCRAPGPSDPFNRQPPPQPNPPEPAAERAAAAEPQQGLGTDELRHGLGFGGRDVPSTTSIPPSASSRRGRR